MRGGSGGRKSGGRGREEGARWEGGGRSGGREKGGSGGREEGGVAGGRREEAALVEYMPEWVCSCNAFPSSMTGSVPVHRHRTIIVCCILLVEGGGV